MPGIVTSAIGSSSLFEDFAVLEEDDPDGHNPPPAALRAARRSSASSHKERCAAAETPDSYTTRGDTKQEGEPALARSCVMREKTPVGDEISSAPAAPRATQATPRRRPSGAGLLFAVGGGLPGGTAVDAGAAVEAVCARAAGEFVLAGSTVDSVVACIADELIGDGVSD